MNRTGFVLYVSSGAFSYLDTTENPLHIFLCCCTASLPYAAPIQIYLFLTPIIRFSLAYGDCSSSSRNHRLVQTVPMPFAHPGAHPCLVSSSGLLCGHACFITCLNGDLAGHPGQVGNSESS